MLKTRKRWISLLVTLAMLVAFVVPFAGPAAAAGSITALSTPTVVDDPDTPQALGTIKVVVPAGSIRSGDSVIFKLASGFDFATSVPEEAYSTDPGVDNYILVPNTISADGDDNGLLAGNITVNVLDADDEVQITANTNQSLVSDFVFYIYLDGIKVEEGTDEDAVVTFDGPPGTGFPTGKVTVGRSSATGKVELAVSGADTSNDNFDFDLRVKETTAGSLELKDETLKLELPDGYVWTTADATNKIISSLWGDDIIVDINADKEELTIDFKGIDADGDGVVDATEIDPATAEDTRTASAWDITGVLKFTVDDESEVKDGDITVKISGESSTNITEAVVGTYGDFGAKISAKETPTIVAGQDEQEIGDIVITESLEDSLVQGRTITLTLPAGARWQQVYEAEIAKSTPADLPDFEDDEGLQVDFVGYTGSDDRTAKFTVAQQSSDNEAEIKLKDVEVAVEAGFEGDLVVTVGGSAGLSGDVVVAKVVAPVTAKASSIPDVVIGEGAQVAGDLTITENVKGAFIEGETAVLDLPADVEFDGTPTVKVTEGDLKIDNVRRISGNNQVAFDIDRDSDTPSTITVTGIKLKLYRTVPVGNVDLKVQGRAVVETDQLDAWDNSDSAAKVAIANVVTPAPGEQTGTAVFKIGEAKYTVNGKEVTMDVAPIAEAGRTYLPARFVANAMGVPDSNIIWDQANQTVTVIRDARIVQMKVGSNQILVNGVPLTMDVTPKVVPGRVLIPFRFLAQALGAEVVWDAADPNTITLNF